MRPHSRLTAHQSKKFIERKKMRTIVIASLIAVSLLTWTVTASKLTKLNVFSINAVKVNGIDENTASNLQAAALNALDGNYFGIFSRANTLLYPHDNIIAVVSKASPRVQSVTVARSGFNGLNIIVNEKTLAAVVCADLPEFNSGNSLVMDTSQAACYFADSTGYMFKEFSTSTTAGDNYHRYYVPAITDSSASSSDSIIGEYATSTALFVELQSFYGNALKAGIPVQAILVKDDGEYEMYIKNQNEIGDTAVVYFNQSRPLFEELENLNSFYKKMSDESTNNGKRIGFEYIDVRYGSNVFYRKIQ